MITYTKDKIIAENNGKSKSVEINTVLWAVKWKSRFFARMWIAMILVDKLNIDSKQAFTVASQMRSDFETFYSLN
jgi:hypothetical protein